MSYRAHISKEAGKFVKRALSRKQVFCAAEKRGNMERLVSRGVVLATTPREALAYHQNIIAQLEEDERRQKPTQHFLKAERKAQRDFSNKRIVKIMALVVTQ